MTGIGAADSHGNGRVDGGGDADGFDESNFNGSFVDGSSGAGVGLVAKVFDQNGIGFGGCLGGVTGGGSDRGIGTIGITKRDGESLTDRTDA